MLFGTGPIESIAMRAPRMCSLAVANLVIPETELLRVTYEVARRDVAGFFPPALQATLPPLVTWTLHRCRQGPLGPFCLAAAELSCRSGARTRTYLLGSVIDVEAAGEALTAGWGFGARVGEVRLKRAYDRVDASVALSGRAILDFSLCDPVRIEASAIHFSPSMHAAHTPVGLRLLQVDATYRIERNERGRPAFANFVPEEWGEPRLRPTHPVAATFSIAELTLGKLRFMGRPELNAFEGTEPIA